MSLHWAKFYWDDFERDTSCLSLAARGAWISVLCIMSRAPRSGYLLHATGHPYTDEDTARQLRLSLDEWLAVRTELIRTGVASQDSHGTIYNRRMSKEAKDRSKERLRKAEACGKRDKSLLDQRKLPDVFREHSGDFPGEKPEARNQKPETRKTPEIFDSDDGFAELYAAYPVDRRERSPLAMQYYIEATGGTRERHEKLMAALRGYIAATEPRFIRGMVKWLGAPTWDLRPPAAERYETIEEMEARVFAR